MDETTYADVDSALMWLFTMSMNVAADPHRPASSRGTLLMTACHAWDDIVDHRREWRHAFPKAGV
jgi:hypothetical protein